MPLTILILLAALVIMGAIINRRPGEFRITRSISIAAPREILFPHANNLQLWQAWSPWAKLDPQAITTFEGPQEGVGAAMHWKGTKTGEGRMTITESSPSRHITYRLDFKKPMKATNSAEFIFERTGDITVTTWSMTGTNSFMAKAISLFMNCDKMVGTQFEKGLADLKAIGEAQAAQ